MSTFWISVLTALPALLIAVAAFIQALLTASKLNTLEKRMENNNGRTY